MFYALASNLIGFDRNNVPSTLRVKVWRIEGRDAWVITADLRDSGTHLCLDIDQITRLDE